VLMMPTLTRLPAPVGGIRSQAGVTDDASRFSALVRIWNVTGQPAISLPLAETADGIPVGVQLVAAPGRDDLLISVAAQLAAVAQERDRPLVATKGGWGRGSGHPDVRRTEIEDSLRRLRTDSIDLYYLHRVDPETPLEESLGAIKQYRDRGQIRHVGISEVSIDEIERARRVVPIAAVQNHYNLSERKYETVVDYCAREDIVFVPFFPLRGDGGTAVEEIAARHEATPAQIELAWLLRRSPTILPIPGTMSPEHLKE